MNSLQINTGDGCTTFEPGEKIDIVAEWSLIDRPTAVEIRLVWNTQGKGGTDMEVVDTIALDNPQSCDTHRTTIQLPTEPYSFSGKLISLIWGLELVAIGTNESSRIDITIAPKREEVILHRDSIDP